jgi:hypothetical protein
MMLRRVGRVLVALAVVLAAGACGTSRPPTGGELGDGAMPSSDAADGNASDGHPGDGHPGDDATDDGPGDDGGASDATMMQDRNAFPDEGVVSSDAPGETTIIAIDHSVPEFDAGEDDSGD